jgi:hypothetical protein
MPRVIPRLATVIAGLLCCTPLLSQTASSVLVSPAVATLRVGESRSFRVTDNNGHVLHGVHWTASDPGVLELLAGDEVEVTAKQSGKCTITAHADQGSGDAQVEVMEGATMKAGTILWSAPTQPGCQSIQIIQAVPTANGPDLYQTSACPDGTYVTALTSDGMLLWRRKLGAEKNVPAAFQAKSSAAAAALASAPVTSLNTHAASICDAVSLGMKKDVVKDLLTGRALASGPGPSDNLWVVEEDSVQCKLWFEADRVSKKRKILVAQ